MCVYDFLKENEFAPFPRHHIQSFARQLLGSVACRCPRAIRSMISAKSIPSVVLHELHLVHTDLKPENILLVNNDSRVVWVPQPGKVIVLLIYLAYSQSRSRTIHSVMPSPGQRRYWIQRIFVSLILALPPLKRSITPAWFPQDITEPRRSF